MGNLSPKLPWDLANPKWAAVLNPLLANPLVGGNLLPRIVLTSGANTINHRLGQKLQGYIVISSSAQATFWDDQLINQKPDLTLILRTSAPTTVSLYVF